VHIERESVEGIDVRHHIPMTLSEIEEFLLLDVHDTLGDVKERNAVQNSSHVKR
jgi:hypothetical protein